MYCIVVDQAQRIVMRQSHQDNADRKRGLGVQALRCRRQNLYTLSPFFAHPSLAFDLVTRRDHQYYYYFFFYLLRMVHSGFKVLADNHNLTRSEGSALM